MSFQHDMERLRTEYEAGDKSALALAIFGCGQFRKPMPSWVVDAWQRGYCDVAMRVSDWNGVLGKVKVRTPKQMQRDRKKLEQLGELVKLLPSVRRISIERNDDTGKMAALASKMGISAREVRELYYMKVKYNGKAINVLPNLVLRQRRAQKAK